MKILYIEWDDSSVWREWYDEHEFKEYIMKDDSMIPSVGILIEETKERIYLALNEDQSNKKHSGILMIPKSAIRKRKVLKLK